ncbi:MAG: tetratricopeptide repeat protein [Chloroflexota bacterium]|nr:tetratricopeptide repeat protein [Chloroflexota bacterium]
MSRLHMFTRLASAAALAAILVTSVPAFAQDTCDPTVDHYRAGSDAYAAGNYSSAYASFGCFTQLYPVEVYAQQNAEAFNMRGNALRAQGDYAGSLAEYTLAIAAKNNFAIAYNNRGWSHFLLEDYGSALLDFNLAISYDPMLAYAYNNRGLVYQMRGDLRNAASDFEYAISLGLEPASWAQYNLGLVDLVLAHEGSAMLPDAEPETAITTTDNSAEVNSLLNQGQTAHDMGQWSSTVTFMTEALALDANNSLAFYLRGRAYIALDNFDAALGDFERLVELTEAGASYPSREYAYWERAIAHAQTGDFDSARADMQRAAAIDPTHVNNFIGNGTIAALAGDMATAGAAFLDLMQRWEIERVEAERMTIGTTSTVEMTSGRVVSIPFRAETGDTLTIVAASTQADPVLVLLGPDGTPIAGDDDSGFMLTALIQGYTFEATGVYTLLVSHAGGGSEGLIAVSVVPAN